MAMMGEAMMREPLSQEVYMYENPYKDVPKLHKPKYKGTSVRVDIRTTPKVGVNDPCPCNSGKKNKKCCKMTAMPKTETK